MRRVAQCPFVYFWTYVFVWAGIVTEGTVLSCFVQRGVNLQTIWGNNANSNNFLPPIFSFVIPLYRGPRVLPPLCLPLKFPAQWKMGMDLLLKVRKIHVTGMSHLFVSGQRQCICKNHTSESRSWPLMHLSCLCSSDLYIMFSLPRFLTPFPSSGVFVHLSHPIKLCKTLQTTIGLQ